MKKAISIFLAAAMLAGVSMGCSSSPASSGSSSGSASSSAAKKPEFVFRYAENQAKDYPTTQGAYKFAEIVEQKTNGRIKIEVYYGAQLGDEKSVMEQMQFGGIDFARVSLSPLAEFAKQLNVLQLPYLYRDSAHMWKVLEGPIGDQFKNGLGESKLVGLSWYDSGSRNFYNSKKPITKLEDLKGMKIRVQENQMMMDMIKAIGAQPTPMAYGEVYSALQTGVIEAAEN
ncbi:MAG TPA: C4-dicarboxylate ABC transporter, partial [Ruminococcaceae bacterium]|nr:C4-dicarboxylate ABC transporter [Oscillospiraceae bacterium]